MPPETFSCLSPALHLLKHSLPSRRRLFFRSSTLLLRTLDPPGMRTELSLLLLIFLACQGHALKCHTCVASNEDECNRQGSALCPQYADACSTITGPNTVMKSCTYKDFCSKAHSSNSGAKMQCCFSDDCNGPHRSQSQGSYHHNGAGAAASSPVLLVGALLLRLALRQL